MVALQLASSPPLALPAASRAASRGVSRRSSLEGLGSAAATVTRWELSKVLVLVALFLLCCNAGVVNSLTQLGSWDSFTSHVTGASTTFAVFGPRAGLAGVQCAGFGLGATLSGVIITNRRVEFGKALYGLALILAGLLLVGSRLAAAVDLRLAVLFASMAMGVQNGMGLNFCGVVIRTTHMTGVVTDLGCALGRNLCRELAGIEVLAQERRGEARTSGVLLLLYVGYVAGSALGGWVAEAGDGGLLGCAALCLGLGLAYFCYRVCVLKQHAMSTEAASPTRSARPVAPQPSKPDLERGVREEVKPAATEPAVEQPPAAVFCGLAFLAANAGAVNHACQVGTWNGFVTHVTGNSTTIGLAAGLGHDGYRSVVQVASFFFGAAIAGGLIPKRQVEFGKARYGLAMMVVGALLATSWACVEYSKQPGEYAAAESALALALASTAMGLQNGMGLLCGGAVVRTTHMTGVLTDLFVLVGRKLRRAVTGADVEARKLDQEALTLKLLSLLYASFVTGGWLGARGFNALGDAFLILPALSCLFLGCGYASYRLVVLEQRMLEHAAKAQSPQPEAPSPSRRASMPPRLAWRARSLSDSDLCRLSPSRRLSAPVWLSPKKGAA